MCRQCWISKQEWIQNKKTMCYISFISHNNAVCPVICKDRHLHGCIISLGVEVWTHKTSLTPSLYIDWSVPSLESVLRVPILPHSTIFLFNFRKTVPKCVIFCFSFIFIKQYHHPWTFITDGFLFNLLPSKEKKLRYI